jgi:intein-encoded DNA endonuclease-like protein
MGSSNGGSKEQIEPGRKGPSLAVRLELYDEVLRLRSQSYSYSKIIEEVAERYSLSLSKRTISGWINGTKSPRRAGHYFVPKPNPELAYVIGVKAGDASLNVKVKTYQYRIRLQSIDREFVEAFNQAVAKVLACPPHRLWKGDTAKEIHVDFGSYLLHRFLQHQVHALKPFIEHCENCVAAFIKGIFDSEGCITLYKNLTASNSNWELLRYVQFLLMEFFHIETTGPHLGTRKSSLMARRGKSFRRNSDCYAIYVRRESLGRFHEHIGLTIQRKAIRLQRALTIVN